MRGRKVQSVNTTCLERCYILIMELHVSACNGHHQVSTTIKKSLYGVYLCEGVLMERSLCINPLFVHPKKGKIMPTLQFGINFLLVICSNLYQMLEQTGDRCIEISTSTRLHTYLYNLLNRCRNLTMAITGRNMQFYYQNTRSFKYDRD